MPKKKCIPMKEYKIEEGAVTIGDACYIFRNIAFIEDEYTDEDKLKAIAMVLNMETHNGITKTDMLDVIRYLLDKINEYQDH